MKQQTDNQSADPTTTQQPVRDEDQQFIEDWTDYEPCFLQLAFDQLKPWCIVQLCEWWVDRSTRLAQDKVVMRTEPEDKMFGAASQRLAMLAEARGIDSGPIHNFNFLYEMSAWQSAWKTVLRVQSAYKYDHETSRNENCASAACAESPAPQQNRAGVTFQPPVALHGITADTFVLGVNCGPLNSAAYEAVSYLLARYMQDPTQGVSKSQIERDLPDVGDPVKALRRLHRTDPRWAQVIHLPGGKGRGGYRLRHPQQPSGSKSTSKS